jgi:type VI secretion system protein ImpB
MANSFQNEIPKARVNIKLDLHTGNGQKKVELPLKLLVTGISVMAWNSVRCLSGKR